MSDCGACIIGNADGYCEVFDHQEIKKSRKDHQCDECGRSIPKGSPYHYYFTVFEGESRVYHICVACEDIANAFYCDNRVLGTLWEDVGDSDFFHDLTTACFAKLKTPEGRAYLNERWRKWKGLA